ncbi:MAG: hypothetical protein ACETWQ_12995 [Phycisphaerae bacterium]
MEHYGDGICIRTGPDPSRYGKYQVELEAEIASSIEPIKEALESLQYVPVDFDQWGLTYISRKDPDLSVDVDELDDYGENTRVVLRKGRLSESNIDEARCYLELLYRRLINKNQFSRDQYQRIKSYGNSEAVETCLSCHRN